MGKNWLILGAVFLASVVIYHLPDYYGLGRYQTAPPNDKWYTGQVSWFDPWDINVYISAIRWGGRYQTAPPSQLLFNNRYDSVNNDNLAIYFVYTGLGYLFSGRGMNSQLIFHLAAVFFGFAFILVVYWFTGIFIKTGRERWIALTLLVFGGGLGRADLTVPGFTFYSALQRPHEAFSLGFFLGAVGFFWQGISQKKVRYFIWGGVSAFLTVLSHPYNILILAAAFGGFTVREFIARRFLGAGVFLSLGIVWVLYYFSLGRALIANPAFAGLAGQVQQAASPINAILGWGILLILATFGLSYFKTKKEIVFFSLWFAGHLLLWYAPFGFQKLFIRGLNVPVVLLAVYGLSFWHDRYKRFYPLMVAGVLMLSLVTSLYIYSERMRAVEEGRNRWIYLTESEGEAIEFLRGEGRADEGVLADYRVANIIPAHTDKKVYAGHEFQTPEFAWRITEVEKFYRGEFSADEARKFLQEKNLNWVFYGVDEAKLGVLNYPGILSEVYKMDGVAVYKVQD